jgi:hypothetical protein
VQYQGCQDLAAAITRHADRVTLPDTLDTAMVQRYLTAIESPLQVQWQSVEAQTDADAAGRAPVRVHHRSLGVGRVLEQDEQRLTIRFVSNGKTRQFDRATVWPLLTWL